MKRIKALFLVLTMTTLLAGNIFATGGIVSVAGLPSNMIAYITTAIMSFGGVADDQCPLRQCTHCPPNTELNENGDCRPPA